MLFERPISSGSMPRVLAAKIICGDCCGNDLLPVKTNLTTAGVCDQCGGCSYEFASRMGDALANYLKAERKRRGEPETLRRGEIEITTEKNNHVKQNNTADRGPTGEAIGTTNKLRLVG